MHRLCWKTFLVWFPMLLIAVIGVMANQRELYGDIYSEFESLSLIKQRVQHLCQREVPVIFFQNKQNVPVRGNGSSIYYHRIEVCCEGYRRSDYEQHKCIPDCSSVSPDNCRNGFCRRPGHCECFDGFVRNELGYCIHTCPIACQQGRCYLNGTCSCNAGYALDPETRLYCRPHCLQACGTNQGCVAPGKCACLPGYRQTSELGCQPVCTPDCGYGKCIGPNQCQCFPGYLKRPQRNVCEAECYINCENGFCESRYKCQCREGYRFDHNTTSCLPECYDNCGHGNGVCMAPGICRCFEGYELRGDSCEPACLGGCGKYGQCLAPNVCGCSPSGQHCIHGSCDVRGHCHCPRELARFLGKCVNLQSLRFDESRSNAMQLEKNNRQLRYEFNALIGRFFNLKYAQ